MCAIGFLLLVVLFHERMDVSAGFAVEPDDAAVVDVAVDDGGHVAVIDRNAPSSELQVRGEDDAPPFVAVGDGLEEQAASFLVEGDVAGLKSMLMFFDMHMFGEFVLGSVLGKTV